MHAGGKRYASPSTETGRSRRRSPRVVRPAATLARRPDRTGELPVTTFPWDCGCGELDLPALERVLNEIARRHESLRTTFREEDGLPRQVISRDLTIALPLSDLSGLAASVREDHLALHGRDEARRTFDLAVGPLIRASLVRLHDRDHALFITVHHIIADGWSLGVLVEEAARLYEAYTRQRPSRCPARNPVRRLRGLAAEVAARGRAPVAARLLEVGVGGRAPSGAAHRPPSARRGPGLAGCRGRPAHARAVGFGIADARATRAPRRSS